MAMHKLEGMKIYTFRQNFPEKYFMKFLRAELESNHLKLVTRYSEVRYIADEITYDEINSWNNDTPVIISAQTGSGKNYFIQSKLLPKVLDENRGKKNLVLIISNRIALTRQSKLDFAKRIAELTGNRKYVEEIEQYYTNEGVDKCYIELGAVTVCSYHQLLERHLLDQRQYKYVICDECHFFTSDATFNPKTDEMLKEIVTKAQNSIRIYLSATPEIACEAIISEEFNFAKNQSDKFIAGVEETTESFDYKIALLSKKNQFLPYQMEQMIERERSAVCKTIKFYYFKRNYDYLNLAGTYYKNDDLIEQIKSSESKWIVFVQSNAEGKDFEEKLSRAEISSCFISRTKIEANKKSAKDNFDEKIEGKKYNPAEEYNYLIANETFRPKVLITTSIIDNGINIKNNGIKKDSDKVLNVAINAIDRTSFLQMLGRIRVSDDTKINLYPKIHSLDDIKKSIDRDSELLVKILANNFQSVAVKQEMFNSQLFKYSNDLEKIFSTYNEYAATQLINLISSLVKIVRNNEPDYKIELGAEMEALKERVYLGFKDGEKASWSKPYSRSIVDLLESDSGEQTRQRYIEEDIRRGVPRNYYDYTTDDTFTKFMFSEMIPDAITADIQDYYEICIRCLNSLEQKDFKILIDREEYRLNKDLSFMEKLKILQKRFQKKYIPQSIEKILEFEKTIQHYKQLADDDNIFDMLTAQLKWLEKTLSEVQEFPLMSSATPQNETVEPQSLEDCIKLHSATSEEIAKNQRGKNEKCLDYTFLESRGIAKGSKLEEQISQEFFDGKSFTELLKDKDNLPKLNIEGIGYRLESFTTNKSDHKTYYLFVVYSKI